MSSSQDRSGGFTDQSTASGNIVPVQELERINHPAGVADRGPDGGNANQRLCEAAEPHRQFAAAGAQSMVLILRTRGSHGSTVLGEPSYLLPRMNLRDSCPELGSYQVSNGG